MSDTSFLSTSNFSLIESSQLFLKNLAHLQGSAKLFNEFNFFFQCVLIFAFFRTYFKLDLRQIK